MPRLFFADNTVLVNFGLIDRFDLLARVLNGNGRWCASIQTECERSSARPELASLAGVPKLLGPPIVPSTAERIRTTILREQLASPGDARSAHFGEAETLAVMESRHSADLLMTDDNGARALAAQLSIEVGSTWQLLRLATRKEWVQCAEMLDYMDLLHNNRRGGPRLNTVSELRSWAGMPPAEILG